MRLRKLGYGLTAVLLFSGLYTGATQETLTSENLHDSWDALLKEYVAADGSVDYQRWQSAVQTLEDYLNTLSNFSPKKDWKKEDKLAYYINLYNAGTIKLILDNYPLKSIKDISNPWSQKFLRIGEQTYSLGHIEHRILRKMGEPRIHFAINCASYSCPPLIREAYTASLLEEQLERVTRYYLNDPKRNKISSQSARISKIFRWFRKDFTTDGQSLISFINPYIEEDLNENTPISFLDYNWNLND